jgi:chitin disaccharide deacetylase
MKDVILNADDFGLTPGVNEGIIRAHRDGILTSTTLMATAPAFDAAVDLAKENPRLGVGCHLVLCGGIAVTSPHKIPSLVDSIGRLPESLASFVVRVTSGRIRTADIEMELRAQIEKIRNAGLEPTHVDTHKHTHVHPRVMGIVARVATDLGIKKIRNPVEDLSDSFRTTSGEGIARFKDIAAAAAVRSVESQFQSIARRYGLRSPDHFLGLAATGRLDAVNLHSIIDALPDGSTEIMLHPGIWDSDLEGAGSRLQRHRETEMKALMASDVIYAAKVDGVRLISYRELQ